MYKIRILRTLFFIKQVSMLDQLAYQGHLLVILGGREQNLSCAQSSPCSGTAYNRHRFLYSEGMKYTL